MSKKRKGTSKPKQRFIYLAVTPDIYELPIDFADTVAELGKRIGKSRVLISSSMCHKRDGSLSGMKFVKVAL